MRTPADELRRVFGLPLPKTEGIATTTGQVLTLPSGVSREQAYRCVKEYPLEGVLRDLATVAARDLADEMSQAGLRASDYADEEGLPKLLADRIIEELKAAPEVFEQTVRDQLKMRG
jgi:hypothetical protein